MNAQHPADLLAADLAEMARSAWPPPPRPEAATGVDTDAAVNGVTAGVSILGDYDINPVVTAAYATEIEAVFEIAKFRLAFEIGAVIKAGRSPS